MSWTYLAMLQQFRLPPQEDLLLEIQEAKRRRRRHKRFWVREMKDGYSSSPVLVLRELFDELVITEWAQRNIGPLCTLSSAFVQCFSHDGLRCSRLDYAVATTMDFLLHCCGVSCRFFTERRSALVLSRVKRSAAGRRSRRFEALLIRSRRSYPVRTSIHGASRPVKWGGLPIFDSLVYRKRLLVERNVSKFVPWG